MNDKSLSDYIKEDIKKQYVKPIKEKNKKVLGERIETVHISGFENSLRIYPFHEMNAYDWGHYMQQMAAMLNISCLIPFKNHPGKHMSLYIRNYKRMEALIRALLECFLLYYDQNFVFIEIAAARGWTRASAIFKFMTEVFYCFNGIQCLMKQLCSIYNSSPNITKKIDANAIPECFVGAQISNAMLKQLKTPNFVNNTIPVEFYPDALLYNPSHNKDATNEFIVLYRMPLYQYSQFMTYFSFRIFALHVHHMDITLNDGLKLHLWHMIGWLAELCTVAVRHKSGRVDMGSENCKELGYTTLATSKGISDDVTRKTTKVTISDDVEIELGRDQVNKTKKEMQKQNKGEELVQPSLYYINEISEIIGKGLRWKQAFKELCKYRAVDRIGTLSYGLMMIKTFVGEDVMNHTENEDLAFTILSEAFSLMIDQRIASTNEDNFVKPTADVVRKLIRYPGTTTIYSNRNANTLPGDMNAHEEYGYGTLQLTMVSNDLYINGFSFLTSSVFPPAAKSAVQARCFELEILEKCILENKDEINRSKILNWIQLCYINNGETDFKRRIADNQKFSIPFVMQLDKSYWMSDSKKYYQCKHVPEAIMLWMLHVVNNMQYRIHDARGKTFDCFWIKNILFKACAHISHKDFKNCPLITKLRDASKQEGNVYHEELMERFKMEIEMEYLQL